MQRENELVSKIEKVKERDDEDDSFAKEVISSFNASRVEDEKNELIVKETLNNLD